MNSKLKIIFAVLGLFIFILLFHWNSFTAPFERDEGEYAYSAQLLLSGGLPYKESLFIFATALLTGFIAAKEYGRVAGHGFSAKF